MKTTPNPYSGYRHPAEITSHAVWLYFRFALSYSEVEDILAARGIVVSYACYQLSVSASDGVGFHDISHILEGFATKAMRDFIECNPLGVSEPQRRLELSFEDSVSAERYSLRKSSSWSTVPVM